MISKVHDALRGQGLVPAAEDIHFMACSTDYRTRLREAVDELGLDELVDVTVERDQLRKALDHEIEAREKITNQLDDTRDEFVKAEQEATNLRMKLGEAMTRLDMVQAAQEARS